MDTVKTTLQEILPRDVCPMIDDYELGAYDVLGGAGIYIFRSYLSFPGV